MYYVARWYDPVLGRFAQADTIVPTASQGTQAWDRYAYVNNDPISHKDPTGHMCEEDANGNCIEPTSTPTPTSPYVTPTTPTATPTPTYPYYTPTYSPSTQTPTSPSPTSIPTQTPTSTSTSTSTPTQPVPTPTTGPTPDGTFGLDDIKEAASDLVNDLLSPFDQLSPNPTYPYDPLSPLDGNPYVPTTPFRFGLQVLVTIGRHLSEILPNLNPLYPDLNPVPQPPPPNP